MTIIDESTVAVVIGGGSGIGRGICLGLAEAGAHVMVADIEVDNARSVADELGDRADAWQVDATDPVSLAALIDGTTDRFGRIHLLSNNVGVVFDAELADATEAQWGWGIECNLLSMVRSVHAFLPHLDASTGRAHIVNTASLAALLVTRPEHTGGVHLGIYHATKHAVLGYTESLAAELAPLGIGVSVLCPGTVKSNLMATSLRNRPQQWGGPEPAEDRADDLSWAMDQEAVGPIVVAGIRNDRFHLLTHPSAIRQIEQRHQLLADDFRFFAELQGADRP